MKNNLLVVFKFQQRKPPLVVHIYIYILSLYIYIWILSLGISNPDFSETKKIIPWKIMCAKFHEKFASNIKVFNTKT